MIELPVSLAVLQWVVLAVLGLFVVVMYRQLAYFLGLAKATSTGGGLELNTRAPAFEYEVAFDHGEKRRFTPEGSQSVLLFVDPGCGSCKLAVEKFAQWRESEASSDVRLIAVVTAPDAALSATEEVANGSFAIARVTPDMPSRLYRVHATPFAFAIDSGGMIVGRGTVTRERDVASLVETLRTAAPS